MGHSLCSQSPENQDQQVGGMAVLDYEKQFFFYSPCQDIYKVKT